MSCPFSVYFFSVCANRRQGRYVLQLSYCSLEHFLCLLMPGRRLARLAAETVTPFSDRRILAGPPYRLVQGWLTSEGTCVAKVISASCVREFRILLLIQAIGSGNLKTTRSCVDAACLLTFAADCFLAEIRAICLRSSKAARMWAVRSIQRGTIGPPELIRRSREFPLRVPLCWEASEQLSSGGSADAGHCENI